jgi:hypothetical protein
MTESISDRATAAHELGHAFVARETGLEPGRLKVYRWLGGGVCEIRDRPELADEATAWAYILTFAAGEVAERIWRDRNEVAAPWSYGSGGDHEAIRYMLSQMPDSRTLADAETEAGTILEACWPELEPLIDELAERGTLREIPAA